MLPADWMSALRDAHCLVEFSLKSARWYIMRASGNNDNSVILFGRHAGISSLLQCLGRLSQPIAPSIRSGAIGVAAARGIVVGAIYQRGALKNHTIVWLNKHYSFHIAISPSSPWYYWPVVTKSLIWLKYYVFPLLSVLIECYCRDCETEFVE